MPAYATPTAILVTAAADGPGLQLPPDTPLTICLIDEPPDTHEPDLPAGAVCLRSADCFTVEAPVQAWIDWAGPGLLVQHAGNERFYLPGQLTQHNTLDI